MNNLKTDDVGGFPFVLDDLRWEGDAVREAFEGLVTAWGGDLLTDTYRLVGAEVTPSGPNFSVAAGFVVIEGEVCKVDSILVPAPTGSNVLQWAVSETTDPAGDKTFLSGPSYSTYRIRKAVVVDIPAGTNTPAIGTPSIHEKIAALAGPHLGNWTTIDLENSTDVVQGDNPGGGGTDTALSTPPPAGHYLKYRIIGKTIDIKFLFAFSVTSHDVAPAYAIKIKNLPFTFGPNTEFDICRGECSNFQEAANLPFDVFHVAGENIIKFRIPSPSASFIKFNRLYQLDTAPAKRILEYGGTVAPFNWTIVGGATFEIE